jgi:hypothetical protein
MKGQLTKSMLFIGVLVYLSGLFLFAYLGSYNRYYADDWCYNADLKSLGFWGTLEGYTYITTYASNRFSLTLFSGLIYQFGVPGVQVMTFLVIAFWVAGLYWLFSNVSKHAGWQIPRTLLFLAGAVVVYYSIHLAPHLYQSMYWRSGLLPYTAPLVSGILVFGWITSPASLFEKYPWLLLAGSFVTAFLAGGFSEAATAVLVTILTLYSIGAWLYRSHAWASRSLLPAVLSLTAVLAAMALLIFSPTSSHRLGLYGEPASLFDLPMMTLGITANFILHSMQSTPLPYIGMVLASFGIGFFLYGYIQRELTFRAWLKWSVIVAALSFITLAACFAPSAYIEQAPPAARTRIISMFQLIGSLSLLAMLAGYYFNQQTGHRDVMTYAVIVVSIFAFIYGARSVYLNGNKIQVYAQRAEIWDERDAIIRTAQAQGVNTIEVRGVDGQVVGGIRDLKDKPGPGYWVNMCAEDYYDMDVIYATTP